MFRKALRRVIVHTRSFPLVMTNCGNGHRRSRVTRRGSLVPASAMEHPGSRRRP